ncbi:DUF3179 domain-containing protein [candidate division KSB1 bacterium]|nr:DUF3179 domain-containing protein [candidate division KSB1 bacterium]
MLEPEDSDYPGNTSTIRVIGIKVGDDTRAYPIPRLASHEVVNDVVAGTPVAVVY